MSLATPSIDRSQSADASRSRLARLPLYGAVSLIAVAFAITIFGQVTEIGTVRLDDTARSETRDVFIRGGDDGVIAVTDATTGALIATIEPGEDGFTQDALRGLLRKRGARVPETEPFRVVRWRSGTLSLTDTATGDQVYPGAFGPDSAAAFAQFFEFKGEDGQ